MKRAAIETIEAAYRGQGSTQEWLRSMTETMAAYPHDRGWLCYTYWIDESGHANIDDLMQIDTPIDLEQVTRVQTPQMPPEYVMETFASVPFTTVLTAGSAPVRAKTAATVKEFFRPHGVRDMVILNAIDPTHRGVYLSSLVSTPLKISRRQYPTWTRVASHIAASFRLRRAKDAEPDAVISTAGKVEHAVEDARSRSAREALRTAALAIDRARTRRSRLDEVEAVDAWQALVSGRWTLIDQIDRGGRRYFIARKNDPEVTRHHSLTRRERQVVGYAALGHTNKLIAYELGLSVSSVAVYLDVAMEKLGVPSRAQLIVAARAFGAGLR